MNLTQQEQDILNDINKGLTNQQIADSRFMIVRTVGNVITRIKKKMGTDFPYRKSGPRRKNG
jgi:DNA-binding NarL/FixJ family response regulator